MRIATRGAAILFGMSLLTALGVAAITAIIRANGGEWWAGTGPDNNWPAVVGYSAVYVALGSLMLLAALLVARAILSVIRRNSTKSS